jgi:hypothetical protein
MTTYLGSVALRRFDEAQAELDRHLAVTVTGRCPTCGEPEPCHARERLTALFEAHGLLPRRRPGVTGVGLRRVPAA